MKPKLSICIPTYNRAKYLPALLDSIVSQVNEKNILEVCISDNGSEDNTYQIVEKYQKQYKYIRYFRWQQNVGYGRNCLKVVEIAKGDYCWIVGSDDVLVGDAIKNCLDILQSNDVDMIMGGSIKCDLNLVKSQVSDFSSYLSYIHPSKNIIFNLSDVSKFIKYCETPCGEKFFTYISIVLFKKEKWDGVVDKIKDAWVFNSPWIHSYVFLSFFKEYDNCQLFCINKNLVFYRGGNFSFSRNDRIKRVFCDLFDFRNVIDEVFATDVVRRATLLKHIQICTHYYSMIKRLILIKMSTDDYLYNFVKQNYCYTFKQKINFAIVGFMCGNVIFRYFIDLLINLYERRGVGKI